MKKPKIDLSMQGIQHFMLHHLEKLILGLAVVLMGVFFWFGFSTKSYDEKTPPELSQLANRAGDHIVKSGWDELKEYRKGDDKADERIRNATLIDIAQYELGRFSGVAAKTRGLRPDPDILDAVPRDMEIHVFQAPILAVRDPKNPGRDYISDLPDASDSDDPTDSKDGKGGRGGSRGGGGLGAGGAGLGADEPQEKDDEETLFGDFVPEIQETEIGGVRPRFEKVGLRSTKAVVTNVVAVNGIIDHKKLYQQFKDTLENAVGWYPPRDKPNYAYVQVQRQGKDGKWNDIGNKVRYEYLVDTFPVQGPEIIHPDYYDEILTGFIPPITQFDYRRYATHSKVPLRIFQSTQDEEEDENQASSSDDAADDGFNFPGGRKSKDDKDDESNKDKKKDRGGIRKGSDRTLYEKVMKAIKPKADFKQFRFFDVGVRPGQYKYRVRVWLKDPNNENPNQTAEAAAGKPKQGGRSMGAGAGGTPDAPDDAGAGRDRGGDPSGQGQEEEEEIKYVYTELEDQMKDVSVRNRIDNDKLLRKGDDPAPDTKIGKDEDERQIANLTYCRPSEWVEFDVNVPDNAGVEFYAGSVSPGKLIKTEKGPVQVGDSSAQLIASVWDSRYDTRIPAFREAFRGDVLNVKINKDQPVNLLHPIDWSVRRLEKYDVNTDAMLVDILGGESLPIRSELPYNIPGEILILDAEGQFHVRNNLQDATEYRHSLFKEDESNEFGKRKKPKKKDGRDGDDSGGGGGLGG